MKKKVIVVAVFSWLSFQVVEAVSLKVLAENAKTVNGDLDELLGYFSGGQFSMPLVPQDIVAKQAAADKAEKGMSALVLPYYNWFSGIATTNKKNPATLTASDLQQYQELFAQYLSFYSTDDELYDYYHFGQVFLMLLNAINLFKYDLSVLDIGAASDITVNKLSEPVLDDAKAYVKAFATYKNFSASKKFKKPFSLDLSLVYDEETACAQKIISFEAQISEPVKPAVKTAAETNMDALLIPLYNALQGNNSLDTQDPDTLTAAQVDSYQKDFALYSKGQGVAASQMSFYQFGSLFLPMLLAKNNFETDLLSLPSSGAPSDITAADVTPALAKDAQQFFGMHAAVKAFLKDNPTFASQVPSDIANDYAQLIPFATAILAFGNQPVQNPITQKMGMASSYILKHFGDAQLSTISFSDMQTSLNVFNETFQAQGLYGASNAFPAEYQMWALYPTTRYWQLQLLTRIEDGAAVKAIQQAARAFIGTYLNGFKPAYGTKSSLLKEPYKTQLASIATEFAVTYNLARLELNKNYFA